ncbi:protein O-mannosyl-transferase TMTC4-like [Hyalella azteca]|uniref:dolichyl-phosphate-mannose--protein mannosyltransferase n=1 Tax=Hyalella azteca TaxID=294128 RepID=A0A8B7N6J9_HYAAZ|nr:protein O-mannosyl-transferase TMTC4-like [Hyalella azteca]
MAVTLVSSGNGNLSRSPLKLAACSSEKKALFYPDISGVSCYAASLIVSLFALVSFVGCIQGEFVFDDSEAIINNMDIRWQSPVADVFANDFWGTKLTHPSSHKSYRPLTVLSFRLNHLVSGLSPGSYHAFNVALHCLVSIAALHVFMHVLYGSRQCALLAGVLFATHPIHTEAVAGIVGRADLLCAFFVFCAVLAYIRAIKEDLHYSDGSLSPGASKGFESNRKSRGSPAVSSLNGDLLNTRSGISKGKHCRARSWLALCAMSTTVAMLCKEVGITALGLCSAYDVLVVSCSEAGGGLLCVLPLGPHRRWCLRKSNGCLLRRHIFLLVVGMSLLLWRFLIMGSAVPRFMEVDNPASFMDSLVYRVLNYQYIYLLNVILLLLPLWLCFDWSMGCIPLIESLTDVRALMVPLLWVALALLVWRGVCGRDATARYVLMCLALGVVPFLPATNLFFRVGFVIAERVLYIPAAGLSCLVVIGMKQLSLSGQVYKRIVGVLYWLLVSVFVLRCRQRTADWCSELQLFKSGLQVCPLNAKVHYNLGKVAGDAGDEVEAVARYREAIRLNPLYDQAMNNLANILKDKGSLREAEALLRNATSLRPDFAAAWMNLGIVQASLGLKEAAHESYTLALQHRPVYPDCLYNLGNLYLERNMSDDALSAWRNATALKPTLSRAWINTLILLDSRQQYETAVTTAHVALKHLPDEASIHFNLANTLGKLGRYKESEVHFLAATRLDPGNANYWSNLGVLYHRWKKYNDAEKTYKHTLKLNPKLKSAQDNLNMLKRNYFNGR